MEQLVQLVAIGVLFAGVAAVAYWTSRFLGGRMGLQRGGDRLRAREWLPLGRDRFLVLVEVDGERLLVGVGPQAVSLLRRVGPARNGIEATASTTRPETGREPGPEIGREPGPEIGREPGRKLEQVQAPVRPAPRLAAMLSRWPSLLRWWPWAAPARRSTPFGRALHLALSASARPGAGAVDLARVRRRLAPALAELRRLDRDAGLDGDR